MQIDVTIAIPVYERDEFFYDAISSALNQTSPCHILVVDNHSSHTKFKDAVDKINRPSVTYVKNEANLGMVGNWNRCIELCTTEKLTILHDDDILHPQFVEFAETVDVPWDALLTESIVDYTTPADFYKISPLTSKAVTRVELNDFVLGNFNFAPGTIFKVQKAKEVGFFTDEYGPILDFHFWLKLVMAGRVFYSDKVLSFYRTSPQQGTKYLYQSMVANTYKLMKLIPAYNESTGWQAFSNYLTYSGGLDFYFLDPTNTPENIEQFFKKDAQFTADHKRYYKFYKIKKVRRYIEKLKKRILRSKLGS